LHSSRASIITQELALEKERCGGGKFLWGGHGRGDRTFQSVLHRITNCSIAEIMSNYYNLCASGGVRESLLTQRKVTDCTNQKQNCHNKNHVIFPNYRFHGDFCG